MKKSCVTLFASLISLSIAGCASDVSFRPELTRDTQAVSDLLSSQEAMIREKGAPRDVYGEVAKTNPFVSDISAKCREPLTKECEFFRNLNEYFVARMMFNAAKYFAGNDEREEAERILHELTARFTSYTTRSEVERANVLLGYLAKWDSFTPGWKAYLLGDYAAALKEFAVSDDPKSLYEVGQMYYIGNGVPIDSNKAAQWYQKAADGGFAPAQYRVGMLYLNGEGMRQDRKEAKKWLEKAEDQKYSPAIEAMVKIRNLEIMEQTSGAGNP